ncbi:MAG: hypothetical protein U1E34_09060 [Amaricoccus sp.]
MTGLGLASPIAVLLLLLPAVVFAGLGLLGSAPGEWGQGALLAWVSLASALLAGTGLGAGPLPWAVPLVGLVAVMVGGPPGLLLAALAAGLLLVPGLATAVPAWLALALAFLPVLVAARHLLGS